MQLLAADAAHLATDFVCCQLCGMSGQVYHAGVPAISAFIDCYAVLPVQAYCASLGGVLQS